MIGAITRRVRKSAAHEWSPPADYHETEWYDSYIRSRLTPVKPTRRKRNAAK